MEIDTSFQFQGLRPFEAFEAPTVRLLKTQLGRRASDIQHRVQKSCSQILLKMSPWPSTGLFSRNMTRRAEVEPGKNA